jgi:uncharacterized protein (DUF3820 family)
MLFGKYRGTDIEDVPSDYLQWFANNFEPENNREDDLLTEVYDEIDHRDRFNIWK